MTAATAGLIAGAGVAQAADSVADSSGNLDWGWYVIVSCSLVFIGAFISMGAPMWTRVRAIWDWDAEITLSGDDEQSTDDEA